MSEDDPKKPVATEAYDESRERTLKIYRLLHEDLAISRNTIRAELENATIDVHYLMAQERLNVAFENAINALDESGLIDDEEVRCNGCGELMSDHDHDGPDDDEGNGGDGGNNPPPRDQMN